MRAIQVWLDEIVQQEFGPSALAGIRVVASERQSAKTAQAKAVAFIDAIAEARHRTIPQTYAMVGQALVRILFRELPPSATPVDSTRSALRQVNQLSKTIVAALLPGTDVPEIDLELVDHVTMRLTFHGSTRLASLIEGIVQGLALHFGEQLFVTGSVVLTFGDPRQRLDVRFAADRRSGTASLPNGEMERREGVLDGVTTVLR